MKRDEILIQEIVKGLETAWNAGDSAAFCASFAADMDFIDVLGNHHQGCPVVERGHRRIFDTFYKGSKQQYAVEKIRFIRPEVAVAFLKARLISYLGVSIDEPNRDAHAGDAEREDWARPTLILEKKNDRWQVVAFQNTRVAEMRA
jgi:uncharacterized protein (TIGR02246 family)